MSRVVVIGGGICGAAAALTLARSGQDVMIVERSDSLGGLVTSFSVGGTPVEIFYHHLIPNELDILELLRELGLDGKVSWFDSRVAVFTQGRMWGFTGPLDLLRFKPLPLIDRIRTGLGALRFGPKRDWRPLDQVPAVKWLADITSKRASREIWTPLLQAKFLFVEAKKNRWPGVAIEGGTLVPFEVSRSGPDGWRRCSSSTP